MERPRELKTVDMSSLRVILSLAQLCSGATPESFDHEDLTHSSHNTPGSTEWL